MTGARWYIQDKQIVDRQMTKFDQLPVEEKLTQGRAAYERICWSNRTRLIRGIIWATVGGILTIIATH